MPGYAAFLRAVNLGPTRKVSSAQLRQIFEALGFEDVAPFRTSGNVAFTAPREPESKLGGRIEAALEDTLGHEVPVFLRTAAQLEKLAVVKPFPASLIKASKGKLQVALLASKPSAKTKREVLAMATDEDPLAFAERELLWLPSGGTRDSKLPMSSIEQLIGPMTQRTMGTIEQLFERSLA